MFLEKLHKDEQIPFLKLARLIANANGFIDDNEQRMLDSYILEMGLKEADKDFENSTLEDIVSVFKSAKSKRIVFLEAIAIAFADGIYHDEQKTLIEVLKESLGVSEEDYQDFKSWIIKINALHSQAVELINA